MNTGGTAYTDPSGNVWAADSGYSPTGGTTSTMAAIANTTSDPLYQNNRGWSAGTTGQYQFTVPNGSYNVTLKWAEIYNGGSPRIFNVTINGVQVLTNFNVGQYWLTAFDQTFATTATAGVITIQFYSATYAPTINAIEITGSGGGGGSTLTTNYTYDRFKRLTQVSMPRGATTQTRTWNYNSTTQRLDSVIMPENGTTSFTYNTDDGTLKTKIDQKGQKIEYLYDANQRLTTIKRYTAAGNPTDDICQRVTITYGTAAPSLGRVSNSSWGASTNCAALNNHTFVESYTYNNPGSVLSKSLAVDGVALTSAQTYDNEGKMLTQSYPASGPTFTYAFDNMGRPNKMTDGLDVDWVKGVQYGVAGEMTDILWRAVSGPVQSTSYNSEHRTYNARLQLTGILATGVTYQNSTWSPATLLDETYTYSSTQNNGRIWKKKETRTNATEELTFSYDALNRLASAVTTAQPQGETWGPQWSQSYQFDVSIP